MTTYRIVSESKGTLARGLRDVERAAQLLSHLLYSVAGDCMIEEEG